MARKDLAWLITLKIVIMEVYSTRERRYSHENNINSYQDSAGSTYYPSNCCIPREVKVALEHKGECERRIITYCGDNPGESQYHPRSWTGRYSQYFLVDRWLTFCTADQDGFAEGDSLSTGLDDYKICANKCTRQESTKVKLEMGERGLKGCGENGKGSVFERFRPPRMPSAA